jgi:hypothetical protein
VAKRFTDSDKWKKVWFRKLNNDQKVFWIYLLDQCDHAGIWEVDFELAGYFCNGINEKEMRDVLQKQYHEFDDGKRWFIKDFISFQYGELNPNVNAHKSVIARLSKHQLNNPSSTVQVAQKPEKATNKRKQLLEIKHDFPKLSLEFPNKQIKQEFDDWVDYMSSHGKQYKNYKSTFRRWLRNEKFNSTVSKQSFIERFEKTPTGLYKAWCNKCGARHLPNDYQLKQNSSCCGVGFSPKQKNKEIM